MNLYIPQHRHTEYLGVPTNRKPFRKTGKAKIAVVIVIVVIILLIILLVWRLSSGRNANGGIANGGIDVKTGIFHTYGEWFTPVEATDTECINRKTDEVCLQFDSLVYLTKAPGAGNIAKLRATIGSDGSINILPPLTTGTWDQSPITGYIEVASGRDYEVFYLWPHDTHNGVKQIAFYPLGTAQTFKSA